MSRLFRARYSFCLTALAIVTGCSAAGSQSDPVPDTYSYPQSAVQRLSAASIVHGGSFIRRLDRITTCPDERVYVSNYGHDDIEVYPKDWRSSPAPCATIVQDTLGPSGLSTDAQGTLYVSNYCCRAISEFPKNARSASRMLHTLGAPQYAYFGRDGTVYSSEPSANRVEEFAVGSTSVTRTIAISNSWGIATDRQTICTSFPTISRRTSATW